MSKKSKKKHSKYQSYLQQVKTRGSALKSRGGWVVTGGKRVTSRSVVFLRSHPILAFLASLLLLLALIIAANTLFKTPVVETEKTQVVKEVDIYAVGQSATITVQAEIEKSGVITIMAQTSGVVQKVHVTEGDSVKKGTRLVSLSTNYQGGNASSLQRQLAGRQYQNVKDTYNTQKEIIDKNRELAEKNSQNTEELRKISVQSTNDTNSLISLNESILAVINDDLKAAEAAGDEDKVFELRKAKAPYESAVMGLRAQSRNSSYTDNTNNPPTQISNINKEIALKQLDIQQKALDLSRDLARIQLNLAAVNEAMMFPASPVPGTVQEVHVHTGELVNPGTPLVTIYSPLGNITANAKVPIRVAQAVSIYEPTTLFIGNASYAVFPDFVSTQATEGQLYSILYNVPYQTDFEIPDKSFIRVEIPVGIPDTNAVDPYVPLDSVFQTQAKALVYVIKDDKAESREVTLGSVIGGDVEVLKGLANGDKVILNRNIVSGDKVKIKQI